MANGINAFITYTKGAQQYVTSEQYETQFLNWLATVDKTSNYTREVYTKVAISCCPVEVHRTEKKEAVVLKLVKE